MQVATWLTHLEYDWESPRWRHWLTAMADGRTLVRYDQRGAAGRSARRHRVSIDTWVEDLEDVVADLESVTGVADINDLQRVPPLGWHAAGLLAQLGLPGGRCTSRTIRGLAGVILADVRRHWETGSADP